jgi:hypothetical protein
MAKINMSKSFFETETNILPFELWGHICYFCDYDSMLNFIKYITTTMDKNTKNKTIIKHLLLVNINKMKVTKTIYATYININAINTFRSFIIYYNNIHISMGDVNYIENYKTLVEFYYCTIQYVNMLLKNIDSKNKKKYIDICNYVIKKKDFITEYDYKKYDNNSFDKLLEYLEMVI